MGFFHFLCPTARQEVTTGIGLDGRTFEATRLKVVRVSCPACLRPHRFLVADGWLEDEELPVLQ